jgi:hypothetical protein
MLISSRVFYISHPGGIVFKFHWAGRAHSRLNYNFILDWIDWIYCFLGFPRHAGERGKENPGDRACPVKSESHLTGINPACPACPVESCGYSSGVGPREITGAGPVGYRDRPADGTGVAE